MRFDLDPGLSGGSAPEATEPRRRTTRKGRRVSKTRPFEMLPTAVTLGNLSGFLAIAYLTDSLHTLDPAVRTALHVKAVGLIFLAMVFDALDGKVARMMGQTSKFGEQVDSICDAVSFGAAPALLFKVVCEAEPGVLRPKVALVLATMFLAGAVLRLARFNVETTPDPEAHRWFKGIPTPGAAAVVASLVYLNAELDPSGGNSWVRWCLPAVVVSLSSLMVSRFRYLHLASWVFRRKSYRALVLLAAIVAVTLLWYEWVLPFGCVAFMLSGPAFWLWTRFIRRTSAEPII